jgi:hypothetical protein
MLGSLIETLDDLLDDLTMQHFREKTNPLRCLYRKLPLLFLGFPASAKLPH